MKKLYWNNELDKVETLETIRTDYYNLFNDQNESFEYYLSGCMYWNNGALTPLDEKIERLQERLDRYGDRLDTEEIQELQTEISEYKRLFTET